MGMASTVDQDHIYCAVKHFGFQHYHRETLWIFPSNTPEHNFVDEASPTFVPFDLIRSCEHSLGCGGFAPMLLENTVVRSVAPHRPHPTSLLQTRIQLEIFRSYQDINFFRESHF